jgi:DNA repair protein RadA/Sms
MGKEKVVWECIHCGHTQPKWTGSCIQCNQWNSFIEQLVVESKRRGSEARKGAKAVRLQELSLNETPRMKTEMKELDRLMGGGIVMGSLILVGGSPGIGKSTLMLQVAHAFAKQEKKVLYICGEESEAQTSLRARRLGVESPHLFLLSETVFDAIKGQIEEVKPDVIIVDSVQILYKSDIPSSAGSVVQVREIATEFMHLAKGCGITTFLIGHVTKSGEIAGPRVLEHIVDVVLELEGERQYGFRILRSIKNRFGPTDDITLFQMKEKGMEEIPNPSLLFLEERKKELAGSVIVPTMEGTRSLLIEIQALVAPTVFANPSRRSIGFDPNRLALLLAVLEKRVGFHLHTSDVFVSIAGGLKISEPAIDLGVLVAIASSFFNRATDPDLIIFGEVGLGGEVRSVPHVENRIKEAIHMGFKRCLFPQLSLKSVSKSISSKIELKGVEMVDDAIHALF